MNSIRVLLLIFALSALTTAKSAEEYKGEIIDLTSSNFEENTRNTPAKQLNFVLFAATWCGHCKHFKNNMYGDVIKKVREDQEHPYDVKFYHIDYDSNKNVFHQFKINSFPRLIATLDNQYYEFKGTRAPQDIYEFTKKIGASDGPQGVQYPDLPSTFAWIIDVYKQAFQEIWALIHSDPKTATLIIGGCLLGLILMSFLTIRGVDYFMGVNNKPQQQQRPQRAQAQRPKAAKGPSDAKEKAE